MEARRYRYYEVWANRVRDGKRAISRRCFLSGRCRRTRWAEHISADLLAAFYRSQMGKRSAGDSQQLSVDFRAAWR